MRKKIFIKSYLRLFRQILICRDEELKVMECPFCKIVKKEANAHIVCETDNLITLLDIDPINEGHILVMLIFMYSQDIKTMDSAGNTRKVRLNVQLK